MKQLIVKFLIMTFMLGFSSGLTEAGWSLLEDFQMQDVAGEEGICALPLTSECDFDVRRYGKEYDPPLLIDDMEAAGEETKKLISDAFLTCVYTPPPVIITPEDRPPRPVTNEAFFQSNLFSPDLSGWEALTR